MIKEPTARLTLENIHLLVPKEARDGKYLCPLCHQWHLSLNTKTAEFNCFSPECEGKAGEIAALIWKEVDRRAAKPPKQEGPPSGKLTLVEYAMAKYLDVNTLRDHFGVYEGKHPFYEEVSCAVAAPYFDEHGQVITTQWRWSMEKGGRRFEPNKPTYLYGGHFLQRLNESAKRGEPQREIFICEGESNTQTLAMNHLAAVGLPGVRNWKNEWAELPCFKEAKRLYFLLDMDTDRGQPEDVAIVGAKKVADSFPDGKVWSVKLPRKDVSDLWLWHMKGEFGQGAEGFRDELFDAVRAAKPVNPVREETGPKVADLGDQVFDACPILKDFVAMTLPVVEGDVNLLICDFLAYAGAAIGLKAYATNLADKHSGATFYLLIANTSSGKGTVASFTNKLFSLVVENWVKRTRTSARTSQALIRMLKEVSERELPTYDEDGNVTGSKENRDFAQGSLLLRQSEVSALFRSMRGESSTLSEKLREAYDGSVLSNELSKERDSSRVTEPYTLSVLGDITPWELTETLTGVDFANGLANRFVWFSARRHQTLARPARMPDCKDLAIRLARVIPEEPVGEIDFSSDGLEAWESWVHGLTFDEGGKLESACARMRPNALRLCVLFAVLDERRPVNGGVIAINAKHVRAAAAIMNRHRETVAQFLERDVAIPGTVDVNAKEVDEILTADPTLSLRKLAEKLSHGKVPPMHQNTAKVKAEKAGWEQRDGKWSKQGV